MSKRDKFRQLAEEALSAVASTGQPTSHLADDMMAGPFAGTSRLKGARLIPIERLAPDPCQPRKTFSEKSLADLAASIQEHGILHPLLVEYNPERDLYIIITGERRYRAAKLAGRTELPCIVSDSLSARQRLFHQLVENLQRDDLSPFEEADAFRLLVDDFHLKHHDLARLIGKSRSYISKTLKLTLIPHTVRRRCLECGLTSREHLIAISQQPTTADMDALINRLCASPTSVKMLRQINSPKRPPKRRPFRFQFAAHDRSFSVTVAFRKHRVSRSEIARALKLALASLDGERGNSNQ